MDDKQAIVTIVQQPGNCFDMRQQTGSHYRIWAINGLSLLYIHKQQRAIRTIHEKLTIITIMQQSGHCDNMWVTNRQLFCYVGNKWAVNAINGLPLQYANNTWTIMTVCGQQMGTC